MSRLVIILLNFFIVCTQASTASDFIDLFSNEKDCTINFNEFYSYKNNLMKEYGLSEVDSAILQKIFHNYCSKNNYKFINEVSNEIFSDNTENPLLLYSIHSSKFSYHLVNINQKIFYNILYSELFFLANNSHKEALSSLDIVNIIQNLFLTIESFEDSEFNEVLKTPLIDHGVAANSLYNLLEKIIFKLVSDNIDRDHLSEISYLLFQSRLNKAVNLNRFGTPLERLSARNEIVKLYLKNYENGAFKYFELTNLISKKNNTSNYDFIYIQPTIEDLSNLQLLRTSNKADEGFSDGNFLDNSHEIFIKTILKINSDKFQSNPIIAINNFVQNHAYHKYFDCNFADTIPESNLISHELGIFKSRFLYYQFLCSDDKGENLLNIYEQLNEILHDLKLEDDMGHDEIQELVSWAQLISMNIEVGISVGEFVINLSDDQILKFLDLAFDFKELEISFSNHRNISSYEDMIHFLSLNQGLLLLERVYKDYDHLISESYKLENRYLGLQKELFYNVGFNQEKLKENLLSNEFQYFDKIAIAKGLELVCMALMNHSSNFAPEYQEDFVRDIKDLDEEFLKILITNSNLIGFFLDNINQIVFMPTFSSILQTESLDKWFVFKDLMTLETFLNYSFLMADKIEDAEYFKITKNRTEQVVSLRPDRIAIEKFQSNYIKNNPKLEFIETFIQHADLQNSYYDFLEAKIIDKASLFDTTFIESGSTEEEYKRKINSLENKIFSEMDKYENYSIFRHKSISLDDISKSLNSSDSMLSFISGQFFTVGIIINPKISMVYPILLSTEGFMDKAANIKSSFSNPRTKPAMNNLSYLYDLFFYDEAIKNSKNVYIITDGVFNGFPFHALFDSSSNEWVIDKANIKYLSSEKLFMHINNNKLSTRKKFLGFGNPALNKKGLSNEVQKFFSERGDFNIENIIDLYELPESEKEIIGISSFFKNKEIFVQSDATEKNLAKALDKNSGYDFIAFATHSLKGVDKFSNDRGLVLTPINENSYDQDGFLSTAEIKNLNLTNDPVIILTACNIIDSQYHESLPFTGITSSFMTAGASSVMLSLWNVDSKSSAILNQSIFTKKNNNKDFSRSMRESVLFLKSQETYKHPYYWAPYIYFGR